MSPAIRFRILLVIVFFYVSKNTSAAAFERAYGADFSATGTYFSVLKDHSIIVVGNAPDTTTLKTGYYLLKIDSSGNVIWQKNVPSNVNLFSNSITSTTDGKIIVLGSRENSAIESIVEVSVFDSSGIFLNRALFPPLNGWGTYGVAAVSIDSSLLFSFYTDGYISMNYYSLYCLNPNLSVKWSDFVGFDGSLTNEHGLSISGNNDVYTLSYYDLYYYSFNPLYHVSNIRKHNLNGVLLSDSLYQFDCTTNAIRKTFDDGAVLCGMHDTLNRKTPVLIRIDSSGQVIFQKHYLNMNVVETKSVIQMPDSGFIILSTIADSVLPGQHNIVVFKTNASGDSLWSHTFGGVLDEKSLHMETDGNEIVIMASTKSFGNNQIYIARMDSSGIIPSAYTIICGNKYLCENDTSFLQLYPAPPSGVHIHWSNGDTLNSTKVMVTGSYSAVLTDSSGDSVETSYCSVYFAPHPSAIFAADTLSICQGSALTVTTPEELTYTYQWSFNGNNIPGATGPSFVPHQPGIYELVVSNYCSSDTAGSFIDRLFIPPAVPVITASKQSPVCSGDSILLSTDYYTSFMYQWFYSTDTTQKVIPGAVDSSYYATLEGNYIVKVTDNNNCFNSSLPFSVLYDNSMEFINSVGPTAFCDGGEVELSVSNGSAFIWSTGDTTQSIRVKNGGSYSVSFRDLEGCLKQPDTVFIKVFNNPMVTLGNDTSLCLSDSISLYAGTGFSNYLWYNGSTGNSLTIASLSADTLNISVTVIDTNGCTTADTVNVVFDVCSGITPVLANSFILFPNPLPDGQILKVINALPGDAEFILYDIYGKKIASYNLKPDKNFIELKNVQRGVSLYRIITSSGLFVSGQLIIE